MGRESSKHEANTSDAVLCDHQHKGWGKAVMRAITLALCS